jgi:hypothetical protein
MATYTTRGRLVKQAQNENVDGWGTVFNAGFADMVDESTDGITALALTGDVTLTTANGATDQARKRVLNITSSDQHARVITIPAVEKWYIVENESAFRVNIKTASGAAAIVPGLCSAIVKCDGTDCFKLIQPDYGIISTTATNTSAQTHTFTLTGFGCNDFRLEIIGMSNNTSGAHRLSFSSDNVTYTAATSFFQQASGGQTNYGVIEIQRATRGQGVASISCDILSANNTIDATGNAGLTWPLWPWRLSGGVLYVRIDNNSTGNFTAGSVEVWGR